MTILMTIVVMTVGVPWKLALFETMKMFTSTVYFDYDMLTKETKCICAHCEGYTHALQHGNKIRVYTVKLPKMGHHSGTKAMS
jgi:hypothetical protein